MPELAIDSERLYRSGRRRAVMAAWVMAPNDFPRRPGSAAGRASTAARGRGCGPRAGGTPGASPGPVSVSPVAFDLQQLLVAARDVLAVQVGLLMRSRYLPSSFGVRGDLGGV